MILKCNDEIHNSLICFDTCAQKHNLAEGCSTQLWHRPKIELHANSIGNPDTPLKRIQNLAALS